MPRSKLSITHTPGLGAKFEARDKDGDSLLIRRYSDQNSALVSVTDKQGNSLQMELSSQMLRLLGDFMVDHLQVPANPLDVNAK